MTVYVDNARIPFRGMLMCHLVSDESYEELHALADKIGMRREWFQGDHYDIASSKRTAAIREGAVPVTLLELGEVLHRMRERGLRKS